MAETATEQIFSPQPKSATDNLTPNDSLSAPETDSDSIVVVSTPTTSETDSSHVVPDDNDVPTDRSGDAILDALTRLPDDKFVDHSPALGESSREAQVGTADEQSERGVVTDDDADDEADEDLENDEDAGIVTDDEEKDAEADIPTPKEEIEDELVADLQEAKHIHVQQPPAQTPPSTGIFEEIWNSIFTPGVNSRVQRVMNFSFAGLFVSLGALAVATGGNIHVLALIGIAGCLFVSVQW